MWTLALQFVWKILKDPKLLAIVILSILLAGSSVKGYWYKQKAGQMEQKVAELTVVIANLNEINKKITQNRDAVLKQIEDLKTIETKYKSLQDRIDVLKKTCARPVKAVVVSPGTSPSPAKVEGSKPVEAPRVIVLPGRVTTPLPDGTKTVESKPASGEGVKTEQSEPESSLGVKTDKPDKEYQFGGEEYEILAKSIYSDLVLWFNSNDFNKLQPKGPTTSMPNSNLSIPNKASPEAIGYRQDNRTS